MRSILTSIDPHLCEASDRGGGSRLGAIGEARELALPRGGRESPGNLRRTELHLFQLKVSQSGSLQREAEKSSHDDLVIALALAVFSPPRAFHLAAVDLWPTEREPMWKPWP
jgi:hypothetical protein